MHQLNLSRELIIAMEVAFCWRKKKTHTLALAMGLLIITTRKRSQTWQQADCGGMPVHATSIHAHIMHARSSWHVQSATLAHCAVCRVQWCQWQSIYGLIFLFALAVLILCCCARESNNLTIRLDAQFHSDSCFMISLRTTATDGVTAVHGYTNTIIFDCCAWIPFDQIAVLAYKIAMYPMLLCVLWFMYAKATNATEHGPIPLASHQSRARA